MDCPLSKSYLLGFDTETTGTTYGKDAIVSACLVLRNPATGYEADITSYWEINPRIPMNPMASRVNGFTTEYLTEHGMDQEVAITEISEIIVAAQLKNIPLLAYNAPFDVSMLNADLKKIGSAPLDTLMRDNDVDNFLSTTERELLIVDPLVIDRAVSKRTGSRKLIDTTFYYGVQPHGNFHNAVADTTAAVDLIEPITRLYPQAASIRLENLMSFQRESYTSWKDNFNEYLKTQGRSLIQGSWL
nr:exonuclease domain-containing protein [Alloscardovia theropitheci]